MLTPEVIGGLEVAREADRLVVALGAGGAGVVLFAFEKSGGVWEERLAVNGFAGRSGIARAKREGDGITPAGVYSFGEIFGTAEDPGSIKHYRKLLSGDIWVDDPDSKYYNRPAREDFRGKDWRSAENLSAEDVAYKYAIAINYNANPVARGIGSAIFLHCSKGGPTDGCVAVPEREMVELLKFIDDSTLIAIADSLAALLEY